LDNFSNNFPEVVIAYLSYNNITENSLSGGAFYGNSKLSTLTLSSNKIQNIPSNAFTGLENCLSQLNLQSNQISSFPIVGTLNKLSSLNLNSNQISTIFAQTVFPDTLRTLDINYNQA
jgi:Leucine-rich repeat (LRR) protein